MTVYTREAPSGSNAPSAKDAPKVLKLEAAHVGGTRLLVKTTLSRRPDFASDALLLYVDLDDNPETGRQDSREHRGVDLMVVIGRSQVSASHFGPLVQAANTFVAAVKQVDQTVYIVFDGPLTCKAGKTRLRLYAVSERSDGGRSDGTPHGPLELTWSDAKVPAIKYRGVPDLRPLSDYRFHNDLVKLEKLADKGLKGDAVRPAQPVAFGRPRPLVPFAAASRKPGQSGTIDRERVPVRLLEEQSTARSAAAVSFGFPLPQGGVFDLNRLRLLGPDGQAVAAQFTATGFWPDDSLKWVLVDFTAPLGSRAGPEYTIELGNQVRRVEKTALLKVMQTDDAIRVDTGPLAVQINKKRFHLFDDVRLNGRSVAASAPDGARLVDEQGTLFTMSGRAPETVRIEEQGPLKAVLRVEGVYASSAGQPYMRYIARLLFRAGSPRVDLIYTHLNDYLQTEFTDVTSLELPLTFAGGAVRPAVLLPDAQGQLARHTAGKLALFQRDEKQCVLTADDRASSSGRAPGSLQAGTLGLVVHDFWQRWPKGLEADGEQIRIGLLPRQPGPDFGRGLPHQLLFPFVDGFYRFKWGMSFTERVTFDFSGRMPAEELVAEAQMPVVPVLPAAWYVRTQALGPLAAPQARQFALWDRHVAQSYAAFLRERDVDRAFGYFNYGDWYGERGRNWGNNEYDFAHGFFMQFARTGNRDYFRVALAAARHQADVDCVHAYPDPYYIGSNHQHSIGHTGMWTERPRHGTWTWRYDMHTAADNGHTWSEGMVEAWLLRGEAPVMEAALSLGEHIAWGMSQRFKALGTHERSAGWSLKAIMELYRATYDPLYLEAAKRIADVALSEQKFDDGGAWPHLLPGDHSGGRAGARGNAIYLMGVLLQGLAEYHRQTHDPRVPRSLEAGSRWLLKCWNEEAQGWPYTALVSGEPLFPPGVGSNLMAAGPIAYVGQITGRKELVDIAEAALAAVVRAGGSGNGKAIAQQMNFTSGVLAVLQEWHASRDADRGSDVLSGRGEDRAQYLAKTRDAKEHSVRGPDKKTFLVYLSQTDATLQATRKPFGAMQRRAAEGTIEVRDASNAMVQQDRFSTDLSHDFSCPLSGKPGEAFTVLVNDDQRGVWNLAGAGLTILMRTDPGFTIGGVGRGRYHFFVPQGTREFSIELTPGHHGIFTGLVLTPGNKPAGCFQGLYLPTPPGGKLDRRPLAETGDVDLLARHGKIMVRPDAADTGTVWSLVLTAGGDLSVSLRGVPPYLALGVTNWPTGAMTAP